MLNNAPGNTSRAAQSRLPKAIISSIVAIFVVIALASMSDNVTPKNLKQLVSTQKMPLDDYKPLEAAKSVGTDLIPMCPRTDWTQIVTRFGLFHPIPLTKKEAFALQFKPLQIKMARPGSPYRTVFMADGLYDRLAFFNFKGEILGLIVTLEAIEKSMAKQGPWTKFITKDGKILYGIEFRFRRPDGKPCLKNESPVGYGLFIREKNTRQFFEIPVQENVAKLGRLGFSKGECINGMGYHYWKNIECSRIYSVFPMYEPSTGKISGVGVSINHFDDAEKLPSQEQWEVATFAAAVAFNNFSPAQLAVLSQCDMTSPYASMHIMLVDVNTIVCPVVA